MCGEGKNRPGETRRRRQGWSNSFQILNAALYNRVLHSIIQGEECNCRVVSVRREGGSIDDSVSGVPPATGAGTIEKHLDAAINARSDVF